MSAKTGEIYIFSVSGLNCKCCSDELVESLFDLAGVTDIWLDWDEKNLYVATSSPKIKPIELKKTAQKSLDGVRIWFRDHKCLDQKQCIRYFSPDDGLHRANAAGDCLRYFATP